MSRKLKALCAFSLASLATPALAATSPITAYYPDANAPGGPSSAQISINVLASVGGVCGFSDTGAPSGSYDAGQIDVSSWTHQFAFTAECTAPWRIAVTSLNGGLQAGTAAGSAGYVDLAPYTVKINAVPDSGSATTSSCPVDQIKQGTSGSTCNFYGTASASTGLSVQRSYDQTGSYIEVSAPAYAGPGTLVAGSYADTLTVTVSPAT